MENKKDIDEISKEHKEIVEQLKFTTITQHIEVFKALLKDLEELKKTYNSIFKLILVILILSSIVFNIKI